MINPVPNPHERQAPAQGPVNDIAVTHEKARPLFQKLANAAWGPAQPNQRDFFVAKVQLPMIINGQSKPVTNELAIDAYKYNGLYKIRVFFDLPDFPKAEDDDTYSEAPFIVSEDFKSIERDQTPYLFDPRLDWDKMNASQIDNAFEEMFAAVETALKSPQTRLHQIASEAIAKAKQDALV